jgi:glycerophosphoryl diester phosphodiesterase
MVEHKLSIIGHRGNRAAAPENTIEAFHQCLVDQRVDGIELDTWDNDFGLIPVIHDQEVNITTNGNGSVSRMNQSQLAVLRCRFGGKFTDEGIPRLADVFALIESANRTNFLVNVEMKANPEDGDLENGTKDGFASRVGTLIRSFPKLNVVVSSFDHRRVVNLKKQFPEINIALLQEGITVLDTLRSYTGEYGFSWWNLKFSSVSPKVVKAARAAGAKVAAWVANDQQEWERLMKCGVDAIITDKPLQLADWVSETRAGALSK